MTRWLLDALFPRHCVRCGREGASFCASCDAATALIPSVGGIPHGVPLDGLLCAGAYADPAWRRLIGTWKFVGDEEARAAVLARVRPAAAVDAVTWVPLHETRRRARGFDQAEDVARAAARALGVPCVPLLRRVARTRQRSLVAHAQRAPGDLDGAFEAPDLTHALSLERRGVARVLLCDDVFTSGATMGAAAAALKAAGATEVHGYAVARG